MTLTRLTLAEMVAAVPCKGSYARIHRNDYVAGGAGRVVAVQELQVAVADVRDHREARGVERKRRVRAHTALGVR